MTGLNSGLKGIIGAFPAALVSFCVGTATVVLVCAASGSLTASMLDGAKGQPAWIWLGGVCGVVFTTGNIVFMDRIGSVQTVLMPSIGQVLAGLLVDAFGLFDMQVVPLSGFRVFGALVVIAGAALVVVRPRSLSETSGRATAEKPAASGFGVWFWRVLGVVTGSFMAFQTAVNARLGEVVGSSIVASFASFAVGTATIAIVVGIGAVVRWLVGGARPVRRRDFPSALHPRNLFGGCFAACIVVGSTSLAPAIGTGMVVVLSLAGQLATSSVIDGFGLLGAVKRPITPQKAVGLALVLIGVLLVHGAL